MSVIASFIDSELSLLQSVKVRSRIHGFVSLNEFIKKHGRNWHPKELHGDVRKAKIGKCFMNAQKLATEDSRFIYCEGLAIGVIPVLHGWCVDGNGNVVDPTWASRSCSLGSEYFGIALKTSYLIGHLCDTEEWGSVVDDWKNGWPLLGAPTQLWRHEINDSR